MTLVFGHDREVANFICHLLGIPQDSFYPCRAIGLERNGKVIGGVVYNNYSPLGIGNIEMSIATLDKRWCSRHTLRALFRYPFTQLSVGRVTAHCSANDEGVIMFLKKLGFVEEGLHRKAHFTGCDVLSFSMLKEECEWIK